MECVRIFEQRQASGAPGAGLEAPYGSPPAHFMVPPLPDLLIGLASLGTQTRPEARNRTSEKAQTVHGGFVFNDLEAARRQFAKPKAALISGRPAMSEGDNEIADVQTPRQHSSCFRACFRRSKSRSGSNSGKPLTAATSTPDKGSLFRDAEHSVKGGASLIPYILENDMPLSKNELYRRGMIRFASGPPCNFPLLATGKSWTVHAGNNFAQTGSARRERLLA